MQGSQKQIIEAYQRVQALLSAYPAPPPTTYGGPQEVLDDVVAQLTSHSSAQVSGRQLSLSETKRQDSLMRKLRNHHMKPVVRIAKMAIQPEPGVTDRLRMPRSGTGYVKLLASARAMREAAAVHQDVFVQNGLPEDFLERFEAAEGAKLLLSVHAMRSSGGSQARSANAISARNAAANIPRRKVKGPPAILNAGGRMRVTAAGISRRARRLPHEEPTHDSTHARLSHRRSHRFRWTCGF